MPSVDPDSPEGPTVPGSSAPGPGGSEASRYWASNLDPQNLEREEGDAPGLALEDEIRFAWTPDVAAAFGWLIRWRGSIQKAFVLGPDDRPAVERALGLLGDVLSGKCKPEESLSLWPESASEIDPLIAEAQHHLRHFCADEDIQSQDSEYARYQTQLLEEDTEEIRLRLRVSPIMDLGAGLGSMSFAMARRGAKVICVDTSPARLGQLMRRAREAGCADAILPVAAAAEALPFRTGSLPGVFTRSVLIHTDMPRAAEELHRALRPGGRAALVEPQPGNPFAWLYRRTLAPKVWREITVYFTEKEQQFFIDRIGAGRVKPFYVFGFAAFVFQYAWPKPALFESALKVLVAVDGVLLKLIPPARRLAWFGVIAAEKSDEGKER